MGIKEYIPAFIPNLLTYTPKSEKSLCAEPENKPRVSKIFK
jgi:hypothetical protein